MKKKDKLTIHQIIWYFIIFSILGLVIETMYCYVTTGVWESRKGLIYGPFCPVYGVGATALIILLYKLKSQKLKLFVYGGFLGSAFEYIMSYVLEAFYGTRFWDYSYYKFHLNGRICIVYTLFWGILALILICLIKPNIDKVMNKISFKYTKILDTIVVTLLVIDICCTILGIECYKNRAIKLYYGITEYNKKSTIKEIEREIFSNEKMKKTFPNLRFINENGEEIWIKDVI